MISLLVRGFRSLARWIDHEVGYTQWGRRSEAQPVPADEHPPGWRICWNTDRLPGGERIYM